MPDERVKGCIGKPIRALMPRLEALGYNDFMQGSQQVMLSQLAEAPVAAARSGRPVARSWPEVARSTATAIEDGTAP